MTSVVPQIMGNESSDDVAVLLSDHRKKLASNAVYRPWGSFESVMNGEGYKVKRIVVAPGKKLSLQYHHHRSEHWTVVTGDARVTVGEKVMILGPDESVYVPLGAIHRLENPGAEDVVLIEVQCGDYLGEDDIVRVEDDFGRS